MRTSPSDLCVDCCCLLTWARLYTATPMAPLTGHVRNAYKLRWRETLQNIQRGACIELTSRRGGGTRCHTHRRQRCIRKFAEVMFFTFLPFRASGVVSGWVMGISTCYGRMMAPVDCHGWCEACTAKFWWGKWWGGQLFTCCSGHG